MWKCKFNDVAIATNSVTPVVVTPNDFPHVQVNERQIIPRYFKHDLRGPRFGADFSVIGEDGEKYFVSFEAIGDADGITDGDCVSGTYRARIAISHHLAPDA